MGGLTLQKEKFTKKGDHKSCTNSHLVKKWHERIEKISGWRLFGNRFARLPEIFSVISSNGILFA
jgi:hypothetical protein